MQKDSEQKGFLWVLTHRYFFQTLSLVFFNLSFLAPKLKFFCAPVLHCYGCPLASMACPIGAMQSFFSIGSFPFLALMTLVVVGIVFKNFLCFYVCPFGFLQDVLYRLSKKRLLIPMWMHNLKYIVLIVFVLLLPLILNAPFFCKICPAGTLEASIPIIAYARIVEPVISSSLGDYPNPLLSMIGWMFLIKVVLLLIVLCLAVFIRRFFCRCFCPANAIFKISGGIAHVCLLGKCCHVPKPVHSPNGVRLGTILVEQGIINSLQLKKALAYQKQHRLMLGESLLELGYVESEDVLFAVSEQFF